MSGKDVAAFVAGLGTGALNQWMRNKEMKRDEEDREWMRKDRERKEAEYQRQETLRKELGEAYAPRAAQSAEAYQPAVDDEGNAMPANPTAGTYKIDDQFSPTGARMGALPSMEAAQTAATAANQPRAQMQRVGDVYGRAGMADKALGMRSLQRQDELGELQLDQTKQAADRETKLREVGSLLLKGGAAAIPDVYARYNDGMSANVEMGEGGKFTVVQMKGDKEAGRQDYDSLEQFYVEVAGQFDPKLWLDAQKDRRKETRERLKDESEADYKARMAAVAEKNAETNEAYRKDLGAAATTRAEGAGKGKGSAFERMDEADKVSFQSLAKQLEKVADAEIDLIAQGKDADPDAAAALRQRKASIELRQRALLQKYADEAKPAADPLNLRGGPAGSASPTKVTPAEQAARDVEAGLLMLRSEYGGDVARAEAAVREMQGELKKAPNSKGANEGKAMLQGQINRLQAGIDAAKGAQQPSPAAAPKPPAAPTPTAAAAQMRPAPTRATTAIDAAGMKLDAARQAMAQARATLQGYGLRQREADPQGFMQAQAAVQAAQQALQAADAEYQQSIPSMSAAFGRYPKP